MWSSQTVSAVLFGLGRLNIVHVIMLRRVKFYKHLLYNCGAFLCDLFLNFYCTMFVTMTCLVILFGQSVMQLNLYALYLKLMLTFTCTFIFVCIIVCLVFLSVFLWRNKGVHY